MLAYGENGSENAFIFEIKNKFHENAEELKWSMQVRSSYS